MLVAGWQGLGDRWNGDSFLLVGGVAAIRAGQDEVLTSIGSDHELLGGSSSDGATVGIHANGIETAALEDACIGPSHGRIGLLQVRCIGMEGVGILHDEFTPAHQSEPGTDLIPEFRLDLIERDGELFVRTQQVTGQIGDHLFMSWTEAETSLLAIFEVEHDSLACCVALPAPAAFPQLGRLQLWQQGLEGAERVKLVAHNRADLAQHSPHQREVGVDA